MDPAVVVKLPQSSRSEDPLALEAAIRLDILNQSFASTSIDSSNLTEAWKLIEAHRADAALAELTFPADASRYHAIRARAFLAKGQQHEAESAFIDVLRIAAKIQDSDDKTSLILTSQINLAASAVQQGRSSLPLIAMLENIVSEHSSQPFVVGAATLTIYQLYETAKKGSGDLELLKRCVEACESIKEDAAATRWLYHAAFKVGIKALENGLFSEAESYLAKAFRVTAEIPGEDCQSELALLLVTSLAFQSKFDEAIEIGRDILNTLPLTSDGNEDDQVTIGRCACLVGSALIIKGKAADGLALIEKTVEIEALLNAEREEPIMIVSQIIPSLLSYLRKNGDRLSAATLSQILRRCDWPDASE